METKKCFVSTTCDQYETEHRGGLSKLNEGHTCCVLIAEVSNIMSNYPMHEHSRSVRFMPVVWLCYLQLHAINQSLVCKRHNDLWKKNSLYILIILCYKTNTSIINLKSSF